MTGRGNVKHQAAEDKTREKIHELRGDIRQQLGVLRRLHAQLEDLASTRQSVGPGFMTADTRELIDRQTRLDRAAARGYAGRIGTTGLTWLNTATVLGTGQVAAPVTVPAVSADAEITFTLQHHVTRLARKAATSGAASGVCVWPRPVTDVDVDQLIDTLGRLVVGYSSRPGLETLLRELDHLEEVAREVVDGPARSRIGGDTDICPWCEQPSLVTHWRVKGMSDGLPLVRCEGRHQCVCEYDTCACHTNPIKNRHEWARGWRGPQALTHLADLQNKRQELIAMETRALDTLDKIRQLHTPTYTLADGVEHTHLVIVHTDDLPEDHECRDDGLDDCNPEYDEHQVPACVECRGVADDGVDLAYQLWPCATARLIEAFDNPELDTK